MRVFVALVIIETMQKRAGKPAGWPGDDEDWKKKAKSKTWLTASHVADGAEKGLIWCILKVVKLHSRATTRMNEESVVIPPFETR